MTTTFELHPQLAADCHRLGSWGDCWILLHGNAGVPWYIVVPQTDAGELHELTPQEREAVDRTLDALARFIKTQHGSQRINLAAIGNRVPQLHIHVVGRSEGDPCWPDVVWGNLSPGPAWRRQDVTALQQALVAADDSGAFVPCEIDPG